MNQWPRHFRYNLTNVSKNQKIWNSLEYYISWTNWVTEYQFIIKTAKQTEEKCSCILGCIWSVKVKQLKEIIL